VYALLSKYNVYTHERKKKVDKKIRPMLCTALKQLESTTLKRKGRFNDYHQVVLTYALLSQRREEKEKTATRSKKKEN
jgi:hypothetical protein